MHSYTLWEDETFMVSTPVNPHIPYSEGLHVIVAPKHEYANAWEDTNITESTFKLSAEICRIMADLKLAPWFNIQANGNWGLLAGAKPFFHVHIYGRNKTQTWAKPIILPEAPNTYQNEPMPEVDRDTLTEALSSQLG
jgi:diadenosine tetraphosphate (Ap4A) HIT family hydrolase